MNIQKSNSTKKAYIKRATTLIARYNKETGEQWDNFPVLSCWFEALSETISKSTFRLYKASLVYYMEQNGSKEVIEQLLSITPENCLIKSHQTTANKSKTVSNKKLDKIFKALDKNKSKYDCILKGWLIAGYITGLRPCEWRQARYNKVTNELIVKNAKSSNDRACGEYRTLGLQDLSDKEINCIIEHLKRMPNDKVVFEKLHQSVGKRLSYLNRQLFDSRKKQVMLYTMRHKFSSNAKANNLSLVEIAAIMGHATDKTATEHYGKKISGVKGVNLVTPSEENKNQVRQIFSNKDALSKKIVF